MAHSHWQVQVGSVRKGEVRVTPKVGVTRTEPHWGTETSERVPGTASKFERHTPSVDWLTESALPCDRGIITNKHSTHKVFLDNGDGLFAQHFLLLM